ncbi:hypothetical protein B0T25DRAFT_576479 [Lasiosphaeria hispida]|uniref:Uncharacterized protein n=1 Tax=Lasiosphaeria hispida TaxID=260671 RepID=A0AAJ0HWA9_9PEZI|nr:hypothetical protein B0T25DRAFT_576479 [Lasiosphaeria hispida]
MTDYNNMQRGPRDRRSWREDGGEEEVGPHDPLPALDDGDEQHDDDAELSQRDDSDDNELGHHDDADTDAELGQRDSDDDNDSDSDDDSDNDDDSDDDDNSDNDNELGHHDDADTDELGYHNDADGQHDEPIPRHLPAILQCVKSAISSSSGRFLRFYRVTPSVFQGLLRDFDRRRDKSIRVTYFGADSRVLLVKTNAPEHESGRVTVADAYFYQLFRMGLESYVSRINTPRTPSIHPGAAVKQPDDGLIPTRARPTGNHFATMVFEVANSQDQRSTHQAMEWWFRNSAVDHERGAVNLVFIANISHDSLGMIHFELWRRDGKRPRKAAIWLKSAENTPAPMDNPDL